MCVCVLPNHVCVPCARSAQGDRKMVLVPLELVTDIVKAVMGVLGNEPKSSEHQTGLFNH